MQPLVGRCGWLTWRRTRPAPTPAGIMVRRRSALSSRSSSCVRFRHGMAIAFDIRQTTLHHALLLLPACGDAPPVGKAAKAMRTAPPLPAYLKAGITSSVRSFKLRCTASGGSSPPGLSSAVKPVRPNISLYWTRRSMTRCGLPKITLVSRISS